MIIQNNLNLAITFMAVLVSVLKDSTATRKYANDGTSVTVTSSALPGYDLKLKGTGLAPGTDDGTIDSFEIVKSGSTSIADGLLPVPVLLTALLVNAALGGGPITPLNYVAFYNLLMPFIFLQLLFTGHEGRDVTEGFGGDDQFTLLGGNDRAFLSGGNDIIDGGDGDHDAVWGKFLQNGIEANLARGTIAEKNTANVTTVIGIEDVKGTRFADTIIGDNGSNKLTGLNGNDVLDGRSGRDNLNGGPGRDIIKGGPGNDILRGGDDADRFVFAPNEGTDRIKDFEDNLDKLDVRRLGFTSLDEAENAATEVNGDVVISHAGTTIIVQNMTKAALFDGDVLF